MYRQQEYVLMLELMTLHIFFKNLFKIKLIKLIKLIYLYLISACLHK